MKSAILLVILEKLLRNGVEYVKDYTVEKEAEVEAFVKKIIPGDDFDDISWELVKSLLPKIFEIALEYIDKIDGASDEEKQTLLIEAVKRLA